MKFNIVDTVTKEVVAQRSTKASAAKWCAKLSEGLNGRYVVSKI